MPDAATILIVDDYPDALDVWDLYLRASGFEVLRAEDGEAALRVACDSLPDLIVMDIGLPGIDGVEATRQLKGHPETPAIPVLAVTAYAMSADEDRMRAAGCDAYLTKPLRLAEFVQVVQGLLAARVSPRCRGEP